MRLIDDLWFAARLKTIRLCMRLSKRMVIAGADLGAWAAKQLRALEKDM